MFSSHTIIPAAFGCPLKIFTHASHLHPDYGCVTTALRSVVTQPLRPWQPVRQAKPVTQAASGCIGQPSVQVCCSGFMRLPVISCMSVVQSPSCGAQADCRRQSDAVRSTRLVLVQPLPVGVPCVPVPRARHAPVRRCPAEHALRVHAGNRAMKSVCRSGFCLLLHPITAFCSRGNQESGCGST